MRIGIIITTYNSEKTIRKCLDSIKSELLDKNIFLKVIIVDDASNDSTKNIILEYYSKGIITKSI